MSSLLFSEAEFPCPTGPTELLKLVFSSWNERCNEARELTLPLRQIDLQRNADIGNPFGRHLDL